LSLPHSNIHGVHPRKIGSGEFIDSVSIVSSNSWPPVDKSPLGGSIISVSFLIIITSGFWPRVRARALRAPVF
jgi:hypothetical protein